ncbi:macrolide family glycosyltransferase [Streptomyces sp. NPDC001339]|uniref:macrolide family glycosyltransferase n=1 Tax=Streptomyces sp. NPDC001339 TaxID=3364563 RepID=UPI0036B93E12
MPKHIALLNIPAHGHVNPTLAMAEELVRRGHRVTYATTEEFAPTVARTGADVLLYESTLEPKPSTEAPPAEFAAWLPLVLIMESARTLPEFEKHFADDLPDLLLYDRTLYLTGRVLAQKWNRPAAQLFPSFAYNENVTLDTITGDGGGVDDDHPARVAFREHLRELARTHEVPPIPPEHFFTSPEDFAVAFVPKEFQPGGDTFGDDFAFVGPCLGDRAFQGSWQPPASGEPVLLVSLGTAFNDRPEFFRTCVAAFSGVPWHVVLSVGGVDPAELGEVPPNIEVHPRVPQLAVLEKASVFVTHSGMGSTMESLHYGTPMVTLPQTVEQAAIAHRVAELGLGTGLPEGGITAEGLRAAVLGLASDAAVRERVRAMGERVRQAGGARRAADALEAYLAHAQRPDQG